MLLRDRESRWLRADPAGYNRGGVIDPAPSQGTQRSDQCGNMS